MNRAALAVFSGLCFGAGFIVPPLWILACVGIIPLLYALRGIRNPLAAAGYCWLAGFSLSLLALSPMCWGVLPLDWYGIASVPLQYVLVAVTWLLSSAVLGLGGAIFGVLARHFGTDSWKDVFIIPGAWALSEWFGSIAFSVIAAGPGSLIGAHFTLNYIGYALANDAALLQLAKFGDVYALSFAAIALGVVIERSARAPSLRERYVLRAFLAFLACTWLAAHPLITSSSAAAQEEAKEDSSSLSIAAVSRYAPPLFLPSQEEESERFEALRALIAPLRDIDVLVFPENAVYLRSVKPENAEAVAEEFTRIGREGKPPLSVDSEDLREDGVLYSRLSYAEGNSPVEYSYKQFLLPLGEYVPYVYRAGLWLFGGAELLEQTIRVRGYALGPYDALASSRGVLLAARFCDEVMSPELYRAQVLAGANILINLSSQSWFHASPLVYREMVASARVRAVATGRWYVQSGNMAPAFALDQYGQTAGETTWNESAVLTISVPALSTTTPAQKAGKLVLLVPLALLLLGLFKRKPRQ